MGKKYGRMYQVVYDDGKTGCLTKIGMEVVLIIISLIVGSFFDGMWATVLFIFGTIGIFKMR